MTQSVKLRIVDSNKCGVNRSHRNVSGLAAVWLRISYIVCLTLVLSISVQAQEPLEFETEQMQDRFDTLTFELRCAVCQNQSLADSDAPLAHDLRREIHAMLINGKTDAEIKQFMVDRYGDFVLYRPPMQPNTWLLWLGPLLMLLIGALVLGFSIKKRSALLNQTDESGQPGKPEASKQPGEPK